MKVASLFTTFFFVFILKCALLPAAIMWEVPAVSISLSGQDAGSAQVVVDDQGNAVSVWTRFDSVNYIIQAATYSSSTQSWTPPLDISVAGQNAENPALSINATGKVVAVWSRFDGTNYIVQSATTETQLGLPNTWSSSTNISGSGFNATHPQVGIDDTGNAVAIWQKEVSLGETNIESASLVANVWGSPAIISLAGESAVMPQIAVNASGVGIAVWRRCNGLNGIIQASVYTPFVGWGVVSDLSAVGESASIPQIGIDSGGAGIAVWRRSNGAYYLIQAAHFTSGSWSSAVDLSQNLFNADSPVIAVQADGQGLASWTFAQDSVTSLIQISKSSTSTPSVWSPAVNVTSVGNSITPDAKIYQDEAVVIWSTSTCSVSSEIQAATINLADTSVGLTTTLSSLASPNDEPVLAVNSSGEVFATWRRASGGNNLIWSVRGTFGNPNICIETTTNSGPTSGGNVVVLTGTHLLGVIAVDFGTTPALNFNVISEIQIEVTAPPGIPGTVNVFVHTQGETSSAEACNVYTYLANPVNPPEPPVIIVGKQIRNKFLTQTELINLIKWRASTTPGVTSYRVYRDGQLLAEISANQPLVYEDHDRKRGVTYVYAVTALVGNSESLPAIVVVP